jgi:hypothetical protein
MRYELDRSSDIILTYIDILDTCQHHPLQSCVCLYSHITIIHLITQHNHCNLTVKYCIYNC